MVEEVVAFIAKEDLKAVQAEINQTYERFTRLTQNKTIRGTGKAEEGSARVNTQIKEIPQE